MPITDGYQWQERPLPDYSAGVSGPNRVSAGADASDDVSESNLGNQFEGADDNASGGNGGGSGGGGGGGGPFQPALDCSSDVDIGNVTTSEIDLPCGIGGSSITATKFDFVDGGGEITGTAGIGSMTWTDGTNTFSLLCGDINSAVTEVKLIELDVCQGGTAGHRQFVCTDAYS